MHITSLPSRYGIGDLGPGAYRFADFLMKAGQCLWQILPLNPTCPEGGNSPYNSYSAFAGNPLLISPDSLVRDGFLKQSDIATRPPFREDRIDYPAVCRFKKRILLNAFERYEDGARGDNEFEKFRDENSGWIDDYSLFIALKEHFGNDVWNRWPKGLREREQRSLKEWKDRLGKRILMETFFQFLFFKQWAAFKKYCNAGNVLIMGDIPMYVHYDSSDAWAYPEIFKLDKNGRPQVVAGVPPDYFSSVGQLWGNPVYNWDILGDTDYSWWIQRMEHNLKLFDLTRIDHFRGFVGYWEVPAGERTALNGKWVEAPAKDFFTKLLRHFTSLPIIAEDLGVITPDVREVMNHFGFPGMRLLLFAFGEDNPAHPYLPHNFIENCLVYTGTHDNNTTVGWFRKEAGPEEKKRLCEYTGRKITEKNVHRELIRLAMSSVARTVIIPMQDILGLGEEARMNLPSTQKGNWRWRLMPRRSTSAIAEKFLRITEIYGRA